MGNVTLTFDAETAKAVQGFLTIENKEKALQARTAQLNRDGAAGARDHGISVQRLAARYGTLGGALGAAGASIGIIRKELALLRQEQDRAASALEARRFPAAQLAQLAGGDPARVRRLVAEAERSRVEGPMTSDQAYGLQFSLESMGLGKDRALFAQLARVAPAAPVAEGVATLQAALGRGETGDTRQVLNKLFAASAVSKATLDQFGPAASQAAKGVSLIGGGDEELLASLAHLSKSTKSIDIAATQIDAFAGVMLQKGITGGLYAGVDELQRRGLSGARLQKFLGQKEALKGYEALVAQRGDITETMAELHRVQDTDLTDRIIASTAAIPGYPESTAALTAETRTQQAREDRYGVRGFRYREAVARTERNAIEGETSALGTWMRTRARGAYETARDYFANDDPTTRYFKLVADRLDRIAENTDRSASADEHKGRNFNRRGSE